MEVFLQLLIILSKKKKKKGFKSDLQMSLVLFAESLSNSLQSCRNDELFIHNVMVTSTESHSQNTFFKIPLKYL